MLQYGGFKCQHVFLTPEFSSSRLANAEAKLILTEDIVHCSPCSLMLKKEVATLFTPVPLAIHSHNR